MSWSISSLFYYCNTSTSLYDTMMYKRIILFQSRVATLGSLYYGRYGDPIKNFMNWQRFNETNGFDPCEMCWFARICMYPILILIIIHFRNNDNKVADYIVALSGLGIIIEWYQYYYQMTYSSNQVKAYICWDASGISCAATDIIYQWFITIPFLCLLAFIILFISSILRKKHIKI